MNRRLVLGAVATAVCVGLLAVGFLLGRKAATEGPDKGGRGHSSTRDASVPQKSDSRTDERAAASPTGDRAEEPERLPPRTSKQPEVEACPQCPVCPDAPRPVCPACPACPSPESVCRPYRAESAALAESLRRLEQEKSALEERLSDSGPRRKYPADTVQERRVLAARQNNLLMEFPSWGEDLVMQDAWVEKNGLSTEERQGLEALYQEFRSKLYEELRSMYADMVGDPEAGANETINALIHNIQGLSPRELCQERVLAILAAVAAGGPLPQPSPDAPACERVILLIFSSVDELDSRSVAMFGEDGKKALWSGTSSFETSTGPAEK